MLLSRLDQRRVRADRQRRRLAAVHLEDVRRDVAFRDGLPRRSRRFPTRHRRRLRLLFSQAQLGAGVSRALPSLESPRDPPPPPRPSLNTIVLT